MQMLSLHYKSKRKSIIKIKTETTEFTEKTHRVHRETNIKTTLRDLCEKAKP